MTQHKPPAPSDAAEQSPKGSGTLAEAPDLSFKGLKLAARTIRALEDMAYKGIPLTRAADMHGIRRDSLVRSFNTPATRAVYNQIVSSVREGAAVQAYLRNVELSHSATSETVRLEANKWIAGVDGIAALKRVEGRMSHSHTFGGFDFGSFGQTIDHNADTPSGGEDDQTTDNAD